MVHPIHGLAGSCKVAAGSPITFNNRGPYKAMVVVTIGGVARQQQLLPPWGQLTISAIALDDAAGASIDIFYIDPKSVC